MQSCNFSNFTITNSLIYRLQVTNWFWKNCVLKLCWPSWTPVAFHNILNSVPRCGFPFDCFVISLVLPQKGFPPSSCLSCRYINWFSFSVWDLCHKILQLWKFLSISTNGRPSLSRTLKCVTFTVKNSKGSRSQISSKQITTIADKAEVTASTNVLLIYMSKHNIILYLRTRNHRTQSLHIPCAQLRIGNLGKNIFLNFRWNCACSVNGRWNAELKRILPVIFVSHSAGQRTRALWGRDRYFI